MVPSLPSRQFGPVILILTEQEERDALVCTPAHDRLPDARPNRLRAPRHNQATLHPESCTLTIDYNLFEVFSSGCSEVFLWGIIGLRDSVRELGSQSVPMYQFNDVH